MIIIKPSFKSFFALKNLDEMARPDTKFHGSEESHSVSSRTPVLYDQYDIYYLYQFPPSFWTNALHARYNRYLLQAIKEGDAYNDKQNIALQSTGGATYVFKDRNTFCHHLKDKLSRDIDVDFFRKHGNTPEDIEKHNALSDEYRNKNIDLGGHLGMSLENPEESKTDKDLWTASGFIAPKRRSMDDAIKKWIDMSSEGWLHPLDDLHKEAKIGKRGGIGRPKIGVDKKEKGTPRTKSEKTVKSWSEAGLLAIRKQMEDLKAYPFDISDSNPSLAYWSGINKGKKSIDEFTGKEETRYIGTALPVMFDGVAIHSHDEDKYNAVKSTLNKFSDLEKQNELIEELNQLDEREITKKRQNIEEKDVNDTWLNDSERTQATQELDYLEKLLEIKNRINKKYPELAGQRMTPELLNKILPDFQKSLKKEMKDIQSSARRYSAHGLSVHEYNRERTPHDPVGTGMDNPLTLGMPKYENLGSRGSRVRLAGGFSPNQNQKHMLHGPEGEWENKFKTHFGVSDKTGNEYENPTHLTPKDKKDIDDKTEVYLNKIGQTLAHNDEVVQYVYGNTHPSIPEMARQLKDLTVIEGLARKKDAPEILKVASKEIKDTETELDKINAETETGKPVEYPIAAGVQYYIQSKCQPNSALQTALENNKQAIINNAEKYIRRTIGHSVWKNYEDTLEKGGSEKHKAARDLKGWIKSKAFSYCNSIAQLQLGDGFQTRRLRWNNQTYSGSAPAGDEKSYDAADQKRNKITTGDEPQSDADYIKQTAQSNQADTTRSPGNLVAKHWYNTGAGENRHGLGKLSDSDTGAIGHSIEVYRKFIKEIQPQIDQNVQQGVDQINSTNRQGATKDDINMMQGISTSFAVFFGAKNDFIDNKVKRREKFTDDEANKYAHDYVLDYFEKNQWTPDKPTVAEPGSIAASAPGGVLPSDEKVPEGMKAQEMSKYLDRIQKLQNLVASGTASPEQSKELEQWKQYLASKNAKPIASTVPTSDLGNFGSTATTPVPIRKGLGAFIKKPPIQQ